MIRAWKSLSNSRKFWLLVFALAQSVLFHLVPGFPRDIWLAVDALAAVVIASIAYEDGQQSRALGEQAKGEALAGGTLPRIDDDDIPEM